MNPPTLLLRDLLAVLFKYQRMILSLVVLTLALVLAFAYLWPERYQSEAKLLIKPGRQNTQAAAVESPLRQQLSTNVLRKEDIISESEIIGSRMLIERALADVGLERMAPPLTRTEGWWGTVKYGVKWLGREVTEAVRSVLVMLGLTVEVPADKRLVLAIEKQLKVQPVHNSDVIEVRFTWPLPDVAQAFAARLVERYLEHHVSVHKGRDLYGFVQAQSGEVRQQLQALDRQLSEFKADSGIVSLAEQRSLLLAQRGALDSALQRKSEQEADLRARLVTVEGQIERERGTLEVGENEGRSPVIDQLRLRLATLEIEERDILRRYDEGSGVVQEKRLAVAEVRRRLEQETQSVRKAASGGSAGALARLREEALRLQAEITGAQASTQTLRGQHAEVTRRLEQLEAGENELARLTRERQAVEGHLKLYEAKQEELRLSEMMDQRLITSVAVVQPPSLPIQPVRTLSLLPNRIFYIVAGLFASLVVGAALAFLRDGMDRTLDTVRKVEVALQAPVLGSMVQASSPGSESRALAGLSEQLPQDARLLMVCASGLGQGVSTTVMQLATGLVRDRAKHVLVVNCNFRDAPSSLTAGRAGVPGLADVPPAQLAETIQTTALPGLDLIARGSAAGPAAAYLDRPGMAAQIQDLAQRYDFVILEVPAVLSHPDALVLARWGVHALVVVDSRQTRAEVAQECAKRLRSAGAQVVGAVMNFRRFYIPSAIYRRT